MNNKKQTKGYKMKKIAILLSILTVLSSGANATGWGTDTIWTKPNYGGGYSFYSGNSFLGYSKPNYGGGSTFFFK